MTQVAPTSASPASADLRERALRIIPGGTQTRAKDPLRWGPVPRFAARAVGGHVWDVDGTEWIDCPMALGAVLLGHAEPEVQEAIARQLHDGISYTLMNPLEVEVAEQLAEMCPGVEAVRFVKTGSEATAAAVRLARACTGRRKVVICGYHGWHDWCADPRVMAGVPAAATELCIVLRYGDLGQLGGVLSAGDVAAVVIDPATAGEVSAEFLAGVVKDCASAGTVSVFDEAITGFRLAPGGVRERYGINPDISCYSKALSNGMPLAAVAGSWSVMGEYPRTGVSGTYAGEALSLAAASAVMAVLKDGTVLRRIAALGEQLTQLMRQSIANHGLDGRLTVRGWPTRPVLAWADDGAGRDRLRDVMAGRNILFGDQINLCARHTEADLAAVAAAFDEACASMASDQ